MYINELVDGLLFVRDVVVQAVVVVVVVVADRSSRGTSSSKLSYPLLSSFGGDSFSAFDPSGGRFAHPELCSAAVQRPGSRWGSSGALLEGTSSVDEEVGECCTTTATTTRPHFCRDSSQPTSGYRSNSLTSRPQMPQVIVEVVVAVVVVVAAVAVAVVVVVAVATL